MHIPQSLLQRLCIHPRSGHWWYPFLQSILVRCIHPDMACRLFPGQWHYSPTVYKPGSDRSPSSHVNSYRQQIQRHGHHGRRSAYNHFAFRLYPWWTWSHRSLHPEKSFPIKSTYCDNRPRMTDRYNNGNHYLPHYLWHPYIPRSRRYATPAIRTNGTGRNRKYLSHVLFRRLLLFWITNSPRSYQPPYEPAQNSYPSFPAPGSSLHYQYLRKKNRSLIPAVYFLCYRQNWQPKLHVHHFSTVWYPQSYNWKQHRNGYFLPHPDYRKKYNRRLFEYSSLLLHCLSVWYPLILSCRHPAGKYIYDKHSGAWKSVRHWPRTFPETPGNNPDGPIRSNDCMLKHNHRRKHFLSPEGQGDAANSNVLCWYAKNHRWPYLHTGNRPHSGTESPDSAVPSHSGRKNRERLLPPRSLSSNDAHNPDLSFPIA